MGDSLCIEQWENPIFHCVHESMGIWLTWGHHWGTNPLLVYKQIRFWAWKAGSKTLTRGRSTAECRERQDQDLSATCNLSFRLKICICLLGSITWKGFLHMTMGNSPSITMPLYDDMSGLPAGFSGIIPFWIAVCSLRIFSFDMPTDVIYMSSKPRLRFVQWFLD